MRKCALCVVLLLVLPASATIPNFVQSGKNWTTCAGSGATVTCPISFGLTTTNNNLIAVWTFWQSASTYIYAASVSDSPGNNFFYSAVGPTVQSAPSSPITAQTFYAKKINGASSDTVTVTFTCISTPTICAGSPSITSAGAVIVEYSGLDWYNPLDSASAGYSTDTPTPIPTALLDSGNANPANSNLVLFAGGITDATTGLTAGSGFSGIQLANSSLGSAITEENTNPITGNNVLQRAQACLGGTCPPPGGTTPGNWLMQMAVFRDASWTVQGGSSPSRTATVLYVDQFPGSDIGVKANNACANFPLGGGTLMFPPGVFSFSTTITNCGRNVTFRGAGAGTAIFPLPPNQLAGTDLVYTGSGIAFSITGNSVQAWLRDLAIDNTGSGTVAIDFDGSLNHSGMDNVSIYPKNCFTMAAVRVGNTTNVVGLIIKDSYVRCDTPSSGGPGLIAANASEVLDVDNTHFNGNGIQLGVLGTVKEVEAFRMIGGAIGSGTDVDAVTVLNAIKASFIGVSFEMSQSTTNPMTGYAINVPSSAHYATAIDMGHCFVSSQAASTTTRRVLQLRGSP